MSPMATFMLRLTNTQDIHLAEQVLVQKLSDSLTLDKAKRLAGQLLSDKKMPVYTLKVLPPLLGITESEYAAAMKQQLDYCKQRHRDHERITLSEHLNTTRSGLYIVTLSNDHPISVNANDPRCADRAIKVTKENCKFGKAKVLAGRKKNYDKTFGAEHVCFTPIAVLDEIEQAEKAILKKLDAYRIRGSSGRKNEWLQGITFDELLGIVWATLNEVGMPYEPALPDKTKELQILDSWDTNASPWIHAIQHADIPSRSLCTNQAILDTILSLTPRSALDIGCGEGWLSDALEQQGIPTLGIDAIPALLDYARHHRRGRFRQLGYAELGKLAGERFDLAVCNFSLIGQASTEVVFAQVTALLNPGGHFVVQTLHPELACGDLPYADGWREGSWLGFSEQFRDPAPWYFRTRESWIKLFQTNGFQGVRMVEPINPETGKPASIIFSATLLTQ